MYRKYEKQDVALIVSSFDAYKSCWAPFCHGMAKYWPDCPFPVYFITNFLDADCGKSIKVGSDAGWSANLQRAINSINATIILYMQEDYWLDRAVNTDNINDYVELIAGGYADHIRLVPVPPPQRDYQLNSRLGIIGIDDEYRVSLQMGLWKRDVLLNLLKQTANGWQLERNGSELSSEYGDRFLCVKRGHGISYTFTAIVDGRWSDAAYRYAENEDIAVDFAGLNQKRWGIRKEIRILLYRRIKRPLFRALGKPRFLR